MFTRKSVFVALTVIALLAMLAPAALAAPEVVSGVVITSPTTAVPVFATSPGSFMVKYTINVSGQQARAVHVDFALINEYDQQVAYYGFPTVPAIPAGTLVNGANPLQYKFVVPSGLPDGFYSVKVCINDGIDPYCTVQNKSVRIDDTPPFVGIERPVWNQHGCTWVTGNQYELFGYAEDNVAVERAWFEYVVFPDGVIDPNAKPLKIGNEDANFEGQDATPVAGFAGEFTALWNSSLVDDTDMGWVRFCAVDSAGNKSCTYPWVNVCIENRVKVDLQKGWNLISTPLVLYNGAIDDVMKHVWNPITNSLWETSPIDKVYTYRNGAAPEWTWWMAGGPNGVSSIEDGYGYWVHTVAPSQIEFVGSWLSIGPVAPPEYPVKSGWNLIGYTHWGQPTDHGNNQSVQEYLGYPMSFSVESMYRYDAARGFYVQVFGLNGEQHMRQGAGYWLALAQGTEGTINP